MSNAAADGAEGSAVVQSVDRALTVLSLLARRGELGVTELAADLGVHKSTAFRLVSTLLAHDLVEQVSDRGKFRLGVGVLRLAGATTVRLDLVQESRQVTADLARRVGETVNITVLSGTEALYLDQVSGPSAIAMHNWVGQRIPLHATSNGKVLLAFGSPVLLGELVFPLRRFTDRTVVDREGLLAGLEEVRRLGYAVAVDELEVGLTAVSAPINSATGSVVASVSASGPTFRIPADRLPEVARQVVAAAVEISHRLGWHGAAALPG
ncbi:MAG TPA: IclR family transcriptional regulator [Kineosporiaceae bacterium]|nr:IclR family transcriptional regulator [Kineosporiaceae bacterium]